MERGNAEHMERLRAKCRCEDCMNFSITGLDMFSYNFKDKEIEKLRRTIAIQDLIKKLEDFNIEQIKEIMDEVIINLEKRGDAGNIPGDLKPITDERLSLL